MVALTRIYTRSGDDGKTALVTGERRPKYDLRVAAYGDVDELNAVIGVSRLHATGEADAMLVRIQNDLFDLGADLATPESGGPPSVDAVVALRIVDSQVDRLEREIDAMNERLSPLRSFVLPGGTPLAAQLHVARTVCRRAERHAVALSDSPDERVSPEAIKYLNRLSDLLFVAARIANDDGRADVLWVPGQTR